MTIPANISSELIFLQKQVLAAGKLENAPFSTVKAIQLNAANLVADIQTTLTSASDIDTWTAPADQPGIVSGFLKVAVEATDQNTLSLMRGIVGRSLSNLNQIV